MKVAIRATQQELTAKMDPRFGRAQYFIIYDVDTAVFEALQNPNIAAEGGAGTQSAQLIMSKGASAVISGSFGPNAATALNGGSAAMYNGNPASSVPENIEAFKAGQLQQAPSSAAGGRGAGTGRGGGGGMGRQW